MKKISKNEMYVKINSYYTATVRSLRGFKEHLFDNKFETFDENFGEITYINEETNPRFEKIVRKLIQMKKDSLRIAQIPMHHTNEEISLHPILDKIGETGHVWRNQGDRPYTVVSACTRTESYLIEYEMPNGTTALNKIDKNDKSSNFTYVQLQTSKELKQNLNICLLINNPQSGSKFKVNM